MLSLSNKLSLTTQPIYKFVNKYSIDFDGVDDRIITDGEVVQYENATYSFWCKASETGTNRGIFGHGNTFYGAFHFNFDGTRPLLFLENNYYRYWNDTSAQDDGEWHHWVVYVDTNNITNSKLYVDGVLQTVYNTVSSGSANAYTESLTIGSDRKSGGNSFVGKIDEFAVYDRELTQAEITRMYNTYYSPNRVANGNFAQEGVEEVTNGDFSQIGSELVTNGDFATSGTPDTSSYTLGWYSNTDGVEIANGKLTLTNSASGDERAYATDGVSSNSILTTNKIYKLTFDITDNTNCSTFQIYKDAGVFVSVTNTVGSYTYYITNTSNTLFLFRNNTVNSSISLDNVSIKEVGQDWSFGTGWSMGDGIASCDGSQTGNSSLSQSSALPSASGKTYKITFTISNYVSGGVEVYPTNTTVGTYPKKTANGTYTRYVTVTSATPNDILYIQADSSFVGSVDNISVKEVGQHWTFGTGWSTDGTKALSDGSSGNLDASITALAGKTYKVTYTILDYVSGDTRFRFTGTSNENGTLRSANGTYVETITLTNSQSIFRMIGSGVYSIDNIVVQELKHDATNLMLNAGDYQSANPLITSTKSMEFDGVDNYLIVNEGYDYDNRTFSVWFNSADNTKTGTYPNTILSQTSSSGGNRWHFRIDDTDNQVKIYDGANIILSGNINTTTIEENRWYNVVMTEDGTTVKFYINGIIQGSGSITLLSASDDVLTFAQEFDVTTPSDFFKGEMTEAGVWNRVLTDLEVASLYNQGVPTDLLVSRGDYVATGLQGYWKMGDGTNDEYPIIYDQTNPTLGSELVTNGDFATDLSGWSGQAGRGSYAWDNGKAKITNDDTSSYPNLSQSITTVVGKVYKITATVEIGTATLTEVRAYSNSNIGSQQLTTDGTIEFYITADDTDFTLHLYLFETGNTGHYCYFDNVSVKEVQGNPATMTNMLEGNITNQYPLTKIRNYYRMGDGILDGYPIIQDQTSPNLAHIPTTNLITYSEDITLSNGYSVNNATISNNQGISPIGDNNATKLTATTNDPFLSNVVNTTNKTFTLSVYAKGVGSSIGKDIQFVLVRDSYLEAKISDSFVLTNDWVRYEATLTLAGTPSSFVIFRLDAPSVAVIGDEVLIWGAQFEEQNQATAYIKSDGIAAVRKSSTTNLIPYSEDFSQSSWSSPSSMTLTPNDTISPNGLLNATKLNFTNPSSTNALSFNYTTIAVTYSSSIFVKYIDSQFIQLWFGSTGFGGGHVNFDLINGLKNDLSGAIGSITDVGNGWFKISATKTSTGGSTSSLAIVTVSSLSSSRFGDEVDGSVYIWGSQLEEQTQAETYAKTTGLPVTIDLFTENNYGTMTNMSASDIVEDTP